MKIAILTLVFNNYGTKLQSYALCKQLHKLYGDSFVVDVINMETPWAGVRNIKKDKLFWDTVRGYKFQALGQFFSFFKWFYEKRKINQIDHHKEDVERTKLFHKINSLIPYTSHRYSHEEIRNGALSHYDILIVGSDQVWNCIKVPMRDVFMLDFAQKEQKCLTYAASFGMTQIPNEEYDNYKNSINNFSSLLIREEEGVELCKLLGRSDATTVLDPTLLLKEEEYDDIIKDIDASFAEGKYILVYSLNQSYRIYDETYKLCKQTGCKMIVLKRDFCPPSIDNYEGSEELFAVSPGGFLKLIKNAQCVVTNSYHALLFSINFKSNFYLYLNNSDEENSRLLTIAKKFSLQDRLYWETGYLPNKIVSINYDEIHNILEMERQRSIKLLAKSLMYVNI